MKITILTIFPEMFDAFIHTSIIKNAINKNLVSIEVVDIRAYTTNKHNKVDDTPFGGGSGMIMTLQPVVDCLRKYQTKDSYTILMSAKGNKLTQKKVRSLSINTNHLILICGRYEGIDDRIVNYIDEEISIGDYIITGGELSSMVLSDAVIRVIDGVIKTDSHQDESYEDGLLEYPQYTKPFDFEGYKVPDVLLSGNHKNIKEFRKKEALRLTYERRKDLLENKELNLEETKLLKLIMENNNEKH